MRKSVSTLKFPLAALAMSCFAANPTHAAASTAFADGDKAAIQAAHGMETDCAKDGMAHGKRQKGWKSSVALGGGHWAFVVDGAKLACTYAALCGTGGCTTKVFSTAPGKPKLIFDDQARGWRFMTPATGRPWLKLDMHGGFCGKTGMEACNQKLDLESGQIKTTR